MRIFSPAAYPSAVILSEPEGGTTESESKDPINLEDGKPASGSLATDPEKFALKLPAAGALERTHS